MLAWLIGFLVLLTVSGALMMVGAVRSARVNGGLGKGRLFDRTALPWTITAVVLLAVVAIGCIVLFT